jgi:hypothetical protein
MYSRLKFIMTQFSTGTGVLVRYSCIRRLYHSIFTDVANLQTSDLLTNSCRTRRGSRSLFGHKTDTDANADFDQKTNTWDDLSDGKHDVENSGRTKHRKEDNIKSECQVNTSMS